MKNQRVHMIIDEVAEYLRSGKKLTASDAASIWGLFGGFHSTIRSLRIGTKKRAAMSIKGASRPNLSRGGNHKVYFLKGEK